ncbi:GNAT family N-acetyltransferase [Nocardioides sp. zg-1228]|uniref:GNAT family N-acetyltransferase n=1 Tax=Nocardioides sp. zg-1228 TaxID=2763008 RepID=UPI001981ECB6|nr:N-acetyltransferase [Nocardioides sp. zg-1228]QSF59276.1 N-acetyltransferase [Nocardioides sp. zg-1228]
MSDGRALGGTVEVREAGDVDTPAVERIVEAAFGEHGVAINDVMARLRGVEEDMAVELVAVADDEIVGCVALSRAWLDARERLVDVLVLSPLAVAPERQGRGIGSRLLAEVPPVAERLGAPLVFLEGAPGYYGNRGWSPASTHGLERPSFRIPEPACQVLLLAGHEPWMTGRLVYPDAWWRLDLVGLRDPELGEVERALGGGR